MAEAPDLDPLQGQTFRSRLDLVRRWQHAELSNRARPPALEPQHQSPLGPDLRVLTLWRLLLDQPAAFSQASVSPLLLRPTWSPPLSCFFVKLPSPAIFSSRISVLVWVCAAALILMMRHRAQASCVGQAIPLPLCRILLPPLLYEEAGIRLCQAIRYGR